MIDQTQLVHDVLSLRDDFELQGVDDALAYRWLLVAEGDAEVSGPVAECAGSLWVGVAG
jgi:hypothetical protein